MRAVLLCTGWIAVVALGVFAPQAAAEEGLLRGPYLQTVTDSSIIVRWRSEQPTDSMVRFGAAPGELTTSVADAQVTTEHEVELTGLTADTVYFYSVGSAEQVLAGDDAEHFLRTSPTAGTVKDTRIWVLGDSGTANGNAASVRDAFKAYADVRPADLLVMLGDNAYGSGTDEEYQAAMFDMYPQVLRQTPVWSTLGNHDGFTADSATQTGPYYDIFSFPKQGEAGGLPSGTEAYYSFDYGNIHFICLESYETDRSPDSPMLSWLAEDIAATNQTWIIAFWHHPPYSKGSHDSDNETTLTEMRANVLPILEAHGVDLVLSGHSHTYERSYFIDGHYDVSDTFSIANQVDSGDGREDSDGAYNKPADPNTANAGAVYVVAGSSGVVGGGALDHEAMLVSLSTLGSMVLDINGDRLDAVFLSADGDVDDYFTLTKGPDVRPPTITYLEATSETELLVVFSETLDRATAEELTNFSLDNGSVLAATLRDDQRSVVLTTTPMINGLRNVLTVSGVTDLAGNVIVPASEAAFTYLVLQTIRFQNGVSPTAAYEGSRDTVLNQNSPNVNDGANPVLMVDGDSGGGGDLSTLLAWDVSEAPAGVGVQSARIELSVVDPTNRNYSVFEVKRAWQESEATWNNASNDSSWQQGGAGGASDRGALIGAVNTARIGLKSISLNTTGVALVQNWMDGGANHGLIIHDSAPANGFDFSSSEHAVASNRPELVVTYAVPPDFDSDGVSNAADNCTLAQNPDQRDTDADGYGNLCDADLNNDGVVNAMDLGLMKLAFFSTGDLDADLNGDSVVNFGDLALMRVSFFNAPGPSGVAP